MDGNNEGKNTIHLDTATRLAYDRTRLAYDRTMIAWVRTATSLIAFGFTVYKFFEIELARAAKPHPMIGARGFALVMIMIGLVSLLIATITHRMSMQRMRKECPNIPPSEAAVLAALVSILGLLALFAAIFRL